MAVGVGVGVGSAAGAGGAGAGGAGAGVGAAMTSVNGAAGLTAGDEAESVTVRAKLDVPGAVGVPEMSPVDGASVSPAGSEPLATCQFE